MNYTLFVESLQYILEDAEGSEEVLLRTRHLISRAEIAFDTDDAEDAYKLLCEAIDNEDYNLVQEAVFRMEEAMDDN